MMPLTTIPARRVDPRVWAVLDEAAALGWPAVDGVPGGGRYRWRLRLLNFDPVAYVPPDLDYLRDELARARAARTGRGAMGHPRRRDGGDMYHPQPGQRH